MEIGKVQIVGSKISYHSPVKTQELEISAIVWAYHNEGLVLITNEAGKYQKYLWEMADEKEIQQVMKLLKEMNDQLVTGCSSGFKLDLEGPQNTRDLGGYQTADGRRIVPHRLLRSGALYSATKGDCEILTDHFQLHTIIDFRTNAEVRERPDPVLTGVTAIANPILDEAAIGITQEEVSPPQKQSADGGEVSPPQKQSADGGAVSPPQKQSADGGAVSPPQKLTADSGEKEGTDPLEGLLHHIEQVHHNPEEYVSNLYRELLMNKQAMSRYREFLNLLLNNQGGAVLWHCSAGKDRVGIGTALLMSALGIPKDTIIKDFMKSQKYLHDSIETMVTQLKKSVSNEHLLDCARVLYGVKESYLTNAINLIEQEFGSLDQYLDQMLDFKKTKRLQLQEKYLI